ncbi:MAG: PDZ domain-containing protein [Chthonomonas sp.]|nr:PDZ domain-containing protein [Chthonomonas sp.]
MVLSTIVTSLVLAASAQAELPRRGVLGAAFSPATAEMATEHKLEVGVGMTVTAISPNMTIAKAGLQPGDLILQINDRPARVAGLGDWVKTVPSGSAMTFKIVRAGKTLTLTTPLVERPRDPGGPNYTVQYKHVTSNGARYRTIITTPKKPGKHPGFMFIQGLSPISYDFTLETSKGDVATLDGPLLFEMANSNYVTMRVEKPGTGDSEGGPYQNMDFNTELDIYRQAMKQLMEQKSLDAKNLFMFGHSMGGSFGPIMATEFPVKGFAVYGTAGRTWFEYLLDVIRYQGIVGGQSYEVAEDEVREGAHLMALAILEKKSLEEIKTMHPKLAPTVDGYFPGGYFNGKNLSFWRQLNDTNFSKYWSKCANVLVVRGASDFVTYDADHQLIADIVNRTSPGKGKFVKLPNSDHLFHAFATEQESMAKFSTGNYNGDFAKLMKDWFAELQSKG